MDTIEQWINCQGQWMYLQPIFDSPDIMKHLPGATKKFKAVNKVWIDTMSQTKANPNVLKSCTREGLLDKFKQANEKLDEV